MTWRPSGVTLTAMGRVRDIDGLLDWGRGLQKQRDLLRDGLSVLLAQLDPEDEVFDPAVALYILTDPDEDHQAEIDELHGAMVATERGTIHA